VLIVQGVDFKYSRQRDHALQGLTFSCTVDGITSIVGKSGIGKSTLIALIAGIYINGDPGVDEYSGQISIGGYSPERLRGPETVSWVPQEPVLLDHLTVTENVLLPLTVNTAEHNATSRAASLLEALGLGMYGNVRPRSLSGGMKTRISLARALISQPKYLFLDEPFAGIDLVNRWTIYKMLISERRRPDMTTILTSHDIPEAAILSDRIILLSRGRETTMATVNENQSFQPNLDKPAGCLAVAREVALPIEAVLFSDAGADRRD